jgi:hypothetical protein
MVTRLLIKQDVVRVLAKRDEVLAALPVPLLTTASGSTTTLKDTKLGRGSGQANRYDSRIIEIVSGDNIGDIAGVDDAGFNGAETLTLSPAIISVANAVNYLMYPLGISPENVNEYLSAILRDTSGPTIYFPALNSDPMMDSSTTFADHWTDVGSPTTTEFVTTEATTGTENIFLGEKSIQVNPAAAGDGIRTLTFDVHEGELLEVTCFVRAATGSVIVTLIDVTDSEAAVTPGAITIDEPAWTEINFSATVPNDCEQMYLQFTAVAASDDMYIGVPVAVQSRSGRSHSMPSWFTHEDQFIEVDWMPQGRTSESDYSFVPLSDPTRAHPSVTFIEDARAIHPMKVEFETAIGRPVYLVCTRGFDDITVDATDTPLDRQYAQARIVADILEDWGDAGAARWARRATRRGRLKGYIVQELRLEANPLVTV